MKPFVLNAAAVVAALLLTTSGIAQAQPRDNSANQFGDRQAGHWGDPGQGQFGNPASGSFDSSTLREPPPGTRALGRVYNGRLASTGELSPYISLPAPSDAPPVSPSAKPASKAKKPAAKKSPS